MTPLSVVQSSNGNVNYLWTYPPTSNDKEGLGGGLTFSMDPNLCAALMPQFSEDFLGVTFATCDNIRASLRRAFTSWADNHPVIAFHDLTEECNDNQLNNGRGPGLYPRSCPEAEIFLTTNLPSAGEDAAATAKVFAGWTYQFYHTNGVYAGSQGVYAGATPNQNDTQNGGRWGAAIGFNTNNVCWYLDATFCGTFHGMKASMGVDE